MRRLFIVLSLLFVLLTVAAPVLAQDVPADPGFTKTELVLIGVLFVAVAVFTVFNLQISRLTKTVLDKLPGVLTEVIKAGADTGWARLEEIVEATPGEADDELAARVKEMLVEWGLLTPLPPAKTLSAIPNVDAASDQRNFPKME